VIKQKLKKDKPGVSKEEIIAITYKEGKKEK